MMRFPDFRRYAGGSAPAGILVLLAVSIGGTQWTRTAGPEGSFTTALAAVGDVLLQGTRFEGIYLTRDRGGAWRRVWREEGAGVDISSMAVLGNRVFAGSRDNGVLESADSGATWSWSNQGLESYSAAALSVVDDRLFAVTPEGLFSRRAAGDWTPMILGSGAPSVHCVTGAGSRLVAGADSGWVFLSSDGGAHWSKARVGLPASPIYSLAVFGSGIVAVGNGASGMHRSDDFGATWTRIGQSDPERFWDRVFRLGDALFAGTQDGGLYRSTDTGKTWNRTDSERMPGLAAMARIGNAFFAGTADGTYRSGDGGATWAPADGGMANTYISALAAAGGGLLAGSDRGIHRSSDGGGSWSLRGGTPALTDVNGFAHSGSHTLAATDYGMFRSSDNGVTWKKMTKGLTDPDGFSPALFSLAASGGHVVAGTFGEIYRSSDSGASWQPSGGLPQSGDVLSLLILDGDVYAGIRKQGIWRLPAGTSAWKPMPSDLDGMDVLALAADGPCLFAGTEAGAARSEDRGATWTFPAGNGPVVQCFLRSGNRLFAGTRYGVYQSADRGDTWIPTGAEIENDVVTSLAAAGDVLYAGTFGAGVWKAAVPDFPVRVRTLSSRGPRPIRKTSPRFDLLGRHHSPGFAFPAPGPIP